MRYRTIFLAVHDKNAKINFPEPTHIAHGVANFTGAKKLCQKIDPLFLQGLKPHTSVQDAIGDLPDMDSTSENVPVKYKTPPQNEYQKLLRKNSKFATEHHGYGIAGINLKRLKYIPQGYKTRIKSAADRGSKVSHL